MEILRDDMRTFMRLFFSFLFLFIYELECMQAQSLDKIGQKDALKLNGAVSVNQMTYLTTDTNAYQNPYTWVLTGSLNINIYDWAIPLSYTISNYNKSFQQPFNNYSMHPSYKWIKAHAGYCQMSFSPYSLNGHTFLGGGVDITPPGKFRFSAMYGRMKRPIEPDTTRREIIPAYKRMGWALKAGYQFPNQDIEISIFKAWDVKNSLEKALLDTSLKPMENVVMTLSGKTKLLGKFTLSGEIAGNSLTHDCRLSVIDRKNIYTSSGLMKAHQSTTTYYAYKSQLTYAFSSANIGIAYEHVDPGYQTLGAYYSNNDFENYTINVSSSFFKNKINISLNTGIQYDNLDNKKNSKTSRYVSSINLSYNVSERLSTTTGYSNFTSYTNIRSPFEDINQPTPIYYVDSLKFTQVSESVNASINWTASTNENAQQTISLMGNLMKTNDNQGNTNNVSNIFTGAISHNLNLKPTNLILSSSVNTSYSEYPQNNSLTIGPTITASKLLFGKTVKTSLSVSKNYSFNNNHKQVENLVIRLNNGYTWQKRHVFSLTAVFSQRISYVKSPRTSVTDLSGTLTYNYTF